MPKCVCGADSRHFGATVNSRLWSMFKIIWKTGTLLGMLSSYHSIQKSSGHAQFSLVRKGMCVNLGVCYYWCLPLLANRSC